MVAEFGGRKEGGDGLGIGCGYVGSKRGWETSPLPFFSG